MGDWSLRAFRSVLKANVPNQTITAIKLLHLRNKVNPKLTQHMTKMIVGGRTFILMI